MIATARRWVVLTHRYLGIVLCVLVLSWFLSGIAMIYARGMPQLQRMTRLEHMPPLNPALIHISAPDAAVRAGVQQPDEVKLLTIMGRPAYQFGPAPPVTIFADTGERLEHLSRDEAIAIGSQFTQLPLTALSYAGVLTQPDQWTLGQRKALPLHKLVGADDLGTVIYVSEPAGEVVITTTRAARRLAWISAIPHWLYFAVLRRHDGLWTSTVLWLSGASCLAVLLGLVLAILQNRARYVGWMRWHYWLGVVFGAITLTWIFSGFLSMQPGHWAATDALAPAVAEALSGAPIDLSQFSPLDAGASIFSRQWVRELEFSRIQGTPVYVARGADRSGVIASTQRHASVGPVSVESVVRRITVSRLPAITDTSLLSTYDAYYRDRDGVLPLPVLRVRFADPDRTWVYIDLQRSRMVAAFSARARMERWLYHGLHSLDIPFLYDKRPFWDAVVIGFCAGGALLSATAIVIGFRRLFL